MGNLIETLCPSTIPFPNWSPTSNWNEDTIKLLSEFVMELVPSQTVISITENTEKFPFTFPTETNKCDFLKTKTDEDRLTKNINSVYPILHETVLNLCAEFILYKRSYGTSIEKEYYCNFTLKDLINKILIKRAAAFGGNYDAYMLMNGKKGIGCWTEIGTDADIRHTYLNIKENMSYDELKLSSFLSVSSYTYFVNKGDRKNRGLYEENRNVVEDNGIIVGMIGPRLVKRKVMEYQEVIISNEQNITENGFGSNVKHSIPKLFANFYNDQSLTYEEAIIATKDDNEKRYTKIPQGFIFDNYIYYKRLSISIDTFLLEANFRAKSSGQMAFVHVVGLGLGVWLFSEHQTKVYMDAFAERIKKLNDKLSNVSDIRFAYINHKKCGNYGHGNLFPINKHPLGGIKIHICNDDPHLKLVGEDAGKVLVVSYAWDSNALPGNEYWCGSLEGSSDPAAACSTQICQIHNPHINPVVCADNLRIVTENGDVVNVEEYKKIVSKRSE